MRTSPQKCSGIDHTAFTLLIHHTCLSLRKHSPDVCNLSGRIKGENFKFCLQIACGTMLVRSRDGVDDICHIAKIWNSLPMTILKILSLAVFISRLKTRLLNLALLILMCNDMTCSHTNSEITTHGSVYVYIIVIITKAMTSPQNLERQH